MKKNFIAGLVTGLSISISLIVIFIISKSILTYVNKNNNNIKNYEYITEKLKAIESMIDQVYLEEVDKSKLEEGIYKGFMASLKDPYSTYYTKEEHDLLKESSLGIYSGIGATVNQNVTTGMITIVKPFVDGPAYNAGMLPGDIIYKVSGEEVTGIDLSEVVSRMKGPEGTKVDIEVIREGVKDPIPLSIVRKKIEVPTIEYEILKDNIGYILISEFDDITVKQFNEAIDELEKENVKGIVIDVRDNPGGLLNSVVKMIDRIILKGLVVYTEDKDGLREERNATDSKKLELPLVILINGNSASASEIFAGTLQDYKAAIILGTTSFGKGIVQTVLPMSDGTAVKLTISKYYTAKGQDIHGVGVTPDIEVELEEELRQRTDISYDEDNQLQEAIKVIKQWR